MSVTVRQLAMDRVLELWWRENFKRFPGFTWDDVTNHARYCSGDLRALAARLQKIQDETP